MSQLAQVLGNRETTQNLSAALSGGNLQHAVLLCAPDGCGRNFAARCLAADYLFPNGGAGAEAVLRGESPEVLLVQGEGRSGQIPIDRIRAVRSDIFLSTLSAAGRVVLLRNAHQMAAPAANALLKVLEEPPADVLFILTARSAAALPATITSRCAVYTLAPAGVPECQALLQAALPAEQDPGLPALLAFLYEGRVGLALAALRDEARLAVVRDAISAATAAAARDTYALLCTFSRYEGREDGAREQRDALLADMTDALEAGLRGGRQYGLPGISPAAITRLIAPISEARIALRGNAAPKITFTALAATLAGAG